jgi:hypothetical protein
LFTKHTEQNFMQEWRHHNWTIHDAASAALLIGIQMEKHSQHHGKTVEHVLGNLLIPPPRDWSRLPWSSCAGLVSCDPCMRGQSLHQTRSMWIRSRDPVGRLHKATTTPGAVRPCRPQLVDAWRCPCRWVCATGGSSHLLWHWESCMPASS